MLHGYEEKIAVEAGELYYVPIDNSKQVQREVQWCFEIGVKVKGYSSEEDYIYDVAEVPNGQYEAKNGVYVNKPDLTGFSKAKTYFVTYDQNGQNETIGGQIITEEPANWYDYQNKIWANVVTISDEKVAYWVWIPRYVYKITYYEDSSLSTVSEEVTSYGTIDVKFVSKENVHKDYVTGVETTYTTELLSSTGYTLPDAFTWNETPLAGYWVSKYEVNSAYTGFNIAKQSNGDIKVSNIDGVNTGTYEYYLNGELKSTTQGLYTFPSSDFEYGRTYEITVKEKYSNGETYVKGTRQVTATTVAPPQGGEPLVPDVSGFGQTYAYYVTYDETGNTETIGDRILIDEYGNPTNASSDWYNYENKIWANIVTASAELTESEKADITTATDKKVAYWVWIPRYEYKTIDTSTESDFVQGDTALKEIVHVRFIDTSVTTPTIEGFKIPDAFTWNGRPLSGYWVSKYEVSE